MLVGVDLRWQLDTVRGAAHSNAAMVGRAPEILVR